MAQMVQVPARSTGGSGTSTQHRRTRFQRKAQVSQVPVRSHRWARFPHAAKVGQVPASVAQLCQVASRCTGVSVPVLRTKAEVPVM